ncbi:hypothetical protein JQ574_25360 [Bradyrhizobium sp. AUGA SZCCT0158]|uniref:hypothetical protein n=1 Tax=Bradyrhizobium sp. AUGA SZCCT0158 TaxID=2807661 RepID=UPI001BA81C83|nr:hypothetical protein [Bradyrhizobium sp. AUGA SZCCT0158]MBR1199330.1 hypothetical protein [Bradyrhizobium sp. AUGA SZCCT0158]
MVGYSPEKHNGLPSQLPSSLMFIVIRECVKHMTKEQARNLILCNKITGKKEDNGYKYVEEVGVSIQGQDANNA